MRVQSSGRAKTSRATVYARVTSTGPAPVSSPARKANVIPPRLTMSFTTTVVTIWRRSGCVSRMASYLLESGLGK